MRAFFCQNCKNSSHLKALPTSVNVGNLLCGGEFFVVVLDVQPVLSASTNLVTVPRVSTSLPGGVGGVLILDACVSASSSIFESDVYDGFKV